MASNCTGTLTLSLSGGGGTAVVNVVLFNGNKSAPAIDTKAGGAASGFATSAGTVTCGLTGVKKTYAADLFGKILTTGRVAYVAQEILDGHGNVSGSGTFQVNGTYTIGTIGGTDTEGSGCLGTLTTTPPKRGSALHFNFGVVKRRQGASAGGNRREHRGDRDHAALAPIAGISAPSITGLHVRSLAPPERRLRSG